MFRYAGACELRRKLPAFAQVFGARASAGPRRSALRARRRALLFAVLLLIYAGASTAILAQQPTVPSETQGAIEHAEDEGEHHDESIGGMIKAMGWPVANFIIFIGVLYYFFNKPFSEYLAGRSSTIRKDLVEAAALKSTATAQLAAIEQKLQALPGELNALRTRGAEEIKAEEQRIAAQAAADRERMLDQTRKEIELQVRLAKKEILEHAADLSVQLATERIRKEITPEDQARIVDRYLDQVKKS
jgi:F-type H+-transporting ATPase subunit b